MKKLLALLALAAMVLPACRKENKPTPKEDDAMEVLTTSYAVPSTEGTLEIPVSANVPLSVTVAQDAQDWLFYVATKAMVDSRLVIGFRANPLAKDRSGKLTIKGNQLATEVTITQAAGAATLELGETSRRVNPRGETISVVFTANDDVRVSPSASWIQVKDVVNGAQQLQIAINDTGAPREAEVEFTAATDASVKAVLVLRQNAANVDPNAINILALGNDAVTASMNYLPKILTEMGYTTINLANLYIGNSDLAKHVENVGKAENVYKLKVYQNGVEATIDTCAVDLLSNVEWDYVVLQQTAAKAADPTSYAVLKDLVDSVRTYCPFSPIAFASGWAPKATPEAYEEIIDAVTTIVMANKEITKIIPVGTTIENMRTSFMGDNMTGTDNVNLSANIGRPLAAYTWAKALTGKSIDALTYVPDDLTDDGKSNKYQFEPYYLPAMLEAVNNAVASPNKVTATTTYAPTVSAVDMQLLKAGMAALGMPESMLANYIEMPVVMIPDAFYNSGGSFAGTVAAAASSNLCTGFTGSKGNTQNNFMATPIFTHDQLPVGTLIVLLDNTLQYRPEGWVTLTTVNDGKDGRPSRPGNVTTPVVTVTDAWWGSFKYRALNISKRDGSRMTQSDWTKALKSIAIFIPKTALGDGLEDYLNGNWNW